MPTLELLCFCLYNLMLFLLRINFSSKQWNVKYKRLSWKRRKKNSNNTASHCKMVHAYEREKFNESHVTAQQFILFFFLLLLLLLLCYHCCCCCWLVVSSLSGRFNILVKIITCNVNLNTYFIALSHCCFDCFLLVDGCLRKRLLTMLRCLSRICSP